MSDELHDIEIRTKRDFLEMLNKIITDEIYVGDPNDDLQREIEVNLWGIGAPRNVIRGLDAEFLLHFLDDVIENREEQVRRSGKGQGMIFYLWLDKQDNQLKFNLVSDRHSELPFRARISQLDSPQPIVEAFLRYNAPGASLKTLHEQAEQADCILPVYTTRLPRPRSMT
jgi:hypothetical protein